MTELEIQLYDALRALDERVAAQGQYADKQNLERQSRRALQAFRAKRREVRQPPKSGHQLHPRIRTVARN